jgi:hypothetical protein
MVVPYSEFFPVSSFSVRIGFIESEAPPDTIGGGMINPELSIYPKFPS